MKYIYGKQDFKTLERGQENCYLLTNGLGGFSSATLAGSAARNDHAFLMACTKAPNHRFSIIHRLSERLLYEDGKACFISSQEFADGREPEDGYRHLSCFTFEDFPEWRYHTDGVEIVKRIGLKHGENTAAVSYEIENRSGRTVEFSVTPFFQFVKKGENPDTNTEIIMEGGCLSSNGMDIYFKTDGEIRKTGLLLEEYYYAYDACDGRRETGRAFANHEIRKKIDPGAAEHLEIVYRMGDAPEGEGSTRPAGSTESAGCAEGAGWIEYTESTEYVESAAEIICGMSERRKKLSDMAGFTHPAACMLTKSADQFISKRESTGGETILAGYPFFEDWGRDTMIALPGCCISTGRYETARSILRTFMANVKNGLMPNLFPEGENDPAYNTADAALLFINSVYLYYEHTGETGFIREAFPVMEEIISCYAKGTDYGIHMDKDGLIMAGKGLDQVTWMDVRVGEILPTPRHGKPVEINAYWYNALCIMDEFAGLLEKADGTGSIAEAGVSAGSAGIDYRGLSEKVKASFDREFWMADKKCLKDVVSGTNADTQIRCNQIWAVSLPFTMLSREKERSVVETVYEKLYTPYGLRTLSMDDEEFRPFYGGEQLERDLAYHQGTVWTFPLGAYYLAYLKVNSGSRAEAERAREKVTGQLEVLEAAMREGCTGQLPEIYDGGNPVSSKGCFAQAWSVGEMLRVFEALEKPDTLR